MNTFRVDKNDRIPPPYRFYCGTRRLIGLPVSMAIMGSVSHASRSSSVFKNTVLPIAFFVVDFPLEVVLDTVLLPVDLGMYAYYCSNPPLDRYLASNDLKGLEEKLKKGVSPNNVDWFLKRQPLLYQAYLNHNEEAFDLLLNYGAKVPIELLQVESHLDEYTYRMLQRVFRDGCPKELQRLTEDELRAASSQERYRNEQLKGCFSYWILKYLEYKDRASPNDKLLVDFMVLLLENGFSPNEWEHMRGELHFSSHNQYPLDVVMANLAMPPAEKEKLVTAMRKHGAQTYRESIHLPPAESIPPMFQPFIDAIAQCNIGVFSQRVPTARSFRYSDSYPGVDGSVLVIDIPFIRDLPNNQKEVLFRKSIPYRRRVSATEWNQEREFLEVPEKCRLVLTPPGKRLPSRRPQGMPTQRGFWEAWFTLPTCELYIEYAKNERLWFGMENGRDDNRDFLQSLIYASANAKTEKPENLKLPDEEVQAGSPLDTLPGHDRMMRDFDLFPSEEKVFPPLLDELGKLPGVNSPVALWKLDGILTGFDSPYVFSFSTHRDMRKISKDDFPLAPHPEEVLVVMRWKIDHYEQHAWAELKGLQVHSHQRVLPEKMPQSLENLKMVFDFPWGKEGKNYWNWRICIKKWDNKPGRREIYLFYGDSVSEERLATILDICERNSQHYK